jgi:hypothetical protein
MGTDIQRIEDLLSRWEAMGVHDRPKLISIGRGVVDARCIVSVLDILDADLEPEEEGGQPAYPAYAKSLVVLNGGKLVSDEPAAAIVTRWRQALGGLPTPIGAEG